MTEVAGHFEHLPDIEKTNNNTGHSFNKIIESATYWLESLPNSSLPLLDLGAAYGVHTLHAINAGRNVIAVDADETHIRILKERVNALQKETSFKSLGLLVDTKIVTLPAEDSFLPNSVSGVLLSEVLHFLKPGQPVQLMKDIFQWLEPGGRFVLTTISSWSFDHSVFENDWKPAGNLNRIEIRKILNDANRPAPKISGTEMLKLAPAYFCKTKSRFSDHLSDCNLGNFLYAFSKLEVETAAKLAGFEIERIDYISPRRYPILPEDLKNETILLVARKPFPS